ncbi:MAG: hypothetical protein AVDCRST_MAG19-2962, partial [uncultured Thermomicrobiales bacterium]
ADLRRHPALAQRTGSGARAATRPASARRRGRGGRGSGTGRRSARSASPRTKRPSTWGRFRAQDCSGAWDPSRSGWLSSL